MNLRCRGFWELDRAERRLGQYDGREPLFAPLRLQYTPKIRKAS